MYFFTYVEAQKELVVGETSTPLAAIFEGSIQTQLKVILLFEIQLAILYMLAACLSQIQVSAAFILANFLF